MPRTSRSYRIAPSYVRHALSACTSHGEPLRLVRPGTGFETQVSSASHTSVNLMFMIIFSHGRTRVSTVRLKNAW
jgi:hypothetical protein